jgi:hypothetical protein
MQVEIGGSAPHSNILTDLVVPAVQILAPFLAAVMIIVQIKLNNDNANRKDLDKLKFDLQTKFYNEIEEKASIASDALLAARNFCYSIMITCNTLNFGQKNQFSVTVPDYIKAKSGALSAIADLTITFEKYEIVMPEIGIFKTALHAYSHDLRESDGEFFPLLMEVLPVDLPLPPPNSDKTTRMPKASPDAPTVARLIELNDKFQKPIDDLGGVLYDLRIAFQNALLGPIFQRTIPSRQPLDPRVVVVEADAKKAALLNEYFEKETAWGKSMTEVNLQVAERIAAQGAAGKKGRPAIE